VTTLRPAALFGLLLVATTAGCGSTAHPNTNRATPSAMQGTRSPVPSPLRSPVAVAHGTVSGQVLGVPCGGQSVPGKPCAGIPMADALVVLVAAGSGNTVTALTDANGSFTVSVPEGRYAASVMGRRFASTPPPPLSVTAGGHATITLVVDSGRR
jgi:carboxypeptidase family protein